MSIIDNLKRERYIIISVYILIYIFFYFINIYTPYSGDDYTYVYNFAETNLTPINSLKDIFSSQYYHYLNVNGRFIPHFLEQVFMNLIGKHWFNFINPLVFISLTYLIYSFIFPNETLKIHSKISLICIISFISLYFLPYTGQTEIWMDGSFNYMWPVVFTLFIVKIYQSNFNYKALHLILIFILSIVAGFTHEGIVIPYAMSFCLLLATKTYKTKKNIIISVGYSLGSIAVALAPGIINRFYSKGEITYKGNLFTLFIKKILDLVTFLSDKYIILIALIILIVIIIKRKYNRYYLIWLYSYIFSLLLLIALSMGLDRIYYSISVISTIIIGIFCKRFITHLNYKYCSLILLGILIFGNIYAINICYKHYSYYNNNFVDQVLTSKNDSIILSIEKPRSSRFIYIDDIWDEVSSRNFYYNKKSIIVLEKDEFNIFVSNKNTYPIISSDNGIDLQYDSNTNTYFFISDKKLHNVNIKGFYHNNSNLKLHQVIIRKILNTYSENNYSSININHKEYNRFNKQYIFFNLPLSTNKIKINSSYLNLTFEL